MDNLVGCRIQEFHTDGTIDHSLGSVHHLSSDMSIITDTNEARHIRLKHKILTSRHRFIQYAIVHRLRMGERLEVPLCQALR